MNIKTIKNLQAKVEYILDTYPATRNSDIVLTRQIIHEYLPRYVHKGKDGSYWYHADTFYLVREDNVKRIRADLNSKGKFLPGDPNVRKARNINEQEWRKFLSYNPELRTVPETAENVQKKVLQPPMI